MDRRRESPKIKNGRKEKVENKLINLSVRLNEKERCLKKRDVPVNLIQRTDFPKRVLNVLKEKNCASLQGDVVDPLGPTI